MQCIIVHPPNPDSHDIMRDRDDDVRVCPPYDGTVRGNLHINRTRIVQFEI